MAAVRWPIRSRDWARRMWAHGSLGQMDRALSVSVRALLACRARCEVDLARARWRDAWVRWRLGSDWRFLLRAGSRVRAWAVWVRIVCMMKNKERVRIKMPNCTIASVAMANQICASPCNNGVVCVNKNKPLLIN